MKFKVSKTLCLVPLTNLSHSIQEILRTGYKSWNDLCIFFAYKALWPCNDMKRAASAFTWPFVLHNIAICCFSNPKQVFLSGSKGRCMKSTEAGNLRQACFANVPHRRPPPPPQPSSKKCPFSAVGRACDAVRDIKLGFHYDADHENCRAMDQHSKSNNNAAKKTESLDFSASPPSTGSFSAPLMSSSFGRRNVHTWNCSLRPLLISNLSKLMAKGSYISSVMWLIDVAFFIFATDQMCG